MSNSTPPLWKHQIDAIEFAKRKLNLALFFQMGTGKTRTTIEILRQQYNLEKKILPTLILCPVIVVPNWKSEIAKFSKIPLEKVILLTGSQIQRLNKLQDALKKFPNQSFLIVTNYEALLMKNLFSQIENFFQPKIMVLDESHRCKNHEAKTTQAAIRLADKASNKYILSGSPILASAMDIFSQFRILDEGKTFGKNFYAFRNTYFYNKNANAPAHIKFPDWRVKPGSLEKINSLIYEKAVRATKADCLDLPPLLKQTLEVELSPEQARLYKEMKRDFIAFLEDKACVATMALTKALRLQQIVSGFVKLEDGEDKRLADTPRLSALRELLEDLTPQNKVIIWAVFRENYKQIRELCEALQIKYVEVHGDISQKEKFENVEKFNTDPEIKVFIGHPGSGGIGINLVAASYSIFFSRSFSLEQDLQAESRNHRGGSEIHEKITRIDLVAKGTIDELVLKALSQKQGISDTLLHQWKDAL